MKNINLLSLPIQFSVKLICVLLLDQQQVLVVNLNLLLLCDNVFSNNCNLVNKQSCNFFHMSLHHFQLVDQKRFIHQL